MKLPKGFRYNTTELKHEIFMNGEWQECDAHGNILHDAIGQGGAKFFRQDVDTTMSAVVDPKQGQALRYNEGKPEYSMLDLKCLEQCVRVLEFGAKKYARNDWKKGMPTSKIIDSMLRHLACLLAGEAVDSESGLTHLGHIQCNAMFLGNKKNEQDIVVLPD